MKKLLIVTLITLIAAVSCIPALDPYTITSGTRNTFPNEDGQLSITVGLESSLQEYLSVSYSVIGVDGRGRYGNFATTPTFNLTFAPREGSTKVAFYCEQIKDFPDSIEEVPGHSHVTFNVWAEMQTPTQGRRITWCGLKETEITSIDILNDYTVKALNEGLFAQPKGTGKNYCVEFDVSLAWDGGYDIKHKWVKGNIFN